MEDYLEYSIVFDAPCWYALDRVVACAQHHVKYRQTLTHLKPTETEKVNKYGYTTIKIAQFAETCGFTEELCSEMFRNENRRHVEYLSNMCAIKFPKSGQIFEEKKIEINVARQKSRVPVWTSGNWGDAFHKKQHNSPTTPARAPANTTVTPAPRPTNLQFTPASPTASASPVSAATPSLALAPSTPMSVQIEKMIEAYRSKSDARGATIDATKDYLAAEALRQQRKINRAFADAAENALQKVIVDIVKTAHNMTLDPRIFLQGIYTLIIQKIRVLDVFVEYNAEDKKIVDSLRETLQMLKTKGSRTDE